MTRMAIGPLGIVAALALGACSLGPSRGGEEGPPHGPDPTARRSTESGDVIGLEGRYGNHAWLGIPFAAPPLGEGRWRAPRPPAPWTGTRQTLAFGPSCTQFASPIGGVTDAEPGTLVGEEDCLYLNVYGPRFAEGGVPRGAARLPVMFWIHGGGNTIGTAAFYDGGNLATTQNVIVVTTNYRLGPFGWFRHAALGQESGTPADLSGNYATLDLVRALTWVRDNIDAFGGNPDNVTIFGESAGGTNVLTLMLSPLSRGLFHRAILQSPGMGTASAAEAENYVDAAQPGETFSSREVVLNLLVRDGAAPDRAAARDLQEGTEPAVLARYLRGRSSQEIMSAYVDDGEHEMFSLPTVIRDGHVLPREEPRQILAQGRYTRVPVIVGSNRDENKLFMFRDPGEVRRIFGIFPWLRNEERYNLHASYRSKMWKAAAVDEPATLLREAQGPSVYAYRWDWDEEPSVLWADLGVILGAAHGLEIPFVFGHFEVGPEGNVIFSEDNEAGRLALSTAMMSYWTEFAYNGAPASGRDGTLPRWTPWDDSGASRDKFLVLDTDAGGGIRMSSESLTREAVAAELEADPRFADAEARCELVAQLEDWWGAFPERSEVALGCSEPPPVGAPGSE